MENEEKAKVIIDYDKYQELLAKANLNEKAIQEIKDVAFKEGYDKGYRLGTTLLTIKSVGQLHARVWMPAIHVQESGINHHR